MNMVSKGNKVMTTIIKKGEFLQFKSGEDEGMMLSNIFLVQKDIDLRKMSIEFLKLMGEDLDNDINNQDFKDVSLIQHYSQKGAPANFIEWLSFQDEVTMIKPIFFNIQANIMLNQRDNIFELQNFEDSSKNIKVSPSSKIEKSNSLEM